MAFLGKLKPKTKCLEFYLNLRCTLLKTAKLKGYVTSKILIASPVPVASIFKQNSIKGVAFGITKVF